MSTTLLARATPMLAMNWRTDSGGTPRPRVVPPGNATFVDQLDQTPFGKHRVGQIEAGEFILAWARRYRQVIQKPIVERPVILELQGAQRVRNAFEGVRLTVREIVVRIDAPVRSGTRVRGANDPVEDRVAQIDITRRHIDLGA
jgi:hypothetical protein